MEATESINPQKLDELIERARNHDADAFEALVDVYAPRLYGFFCRMVGHRTDSEDLVQDVFVRVIRTISAYEHDGKFEAWLFRIAANLARDYGRQRRRAANVSISYPSIESRADDGIDSWAPVPDLGQEPSETAEKAEQRDRLQEALGRLPQADREVIMLRHYGELSFAEIARIMETPIGTALARAHRGLAKLRSWMEAPS
jgi:RNA polymerase sigma-70 factor (ECF subfamily)